MRGDGKIEILQFSFTGFIERRAHGVCILVGLNAKPYNRAVGTLF